jgi:putative methionine-R-sulfoxide reductase with GAF domain
MLNVPNQTRKASLQPDQRRKSNLSLMRTGSDLTSNVGAAVVESSLGDLEELANDMETLSVYSIRADHLAAWSFKIRTALKTVRQGTREQQGKGRSIVVESGSVVASNNDLASAELTIGSRAAAALSLAVNQTSVAPFVSGAIHLLTDSLLSMVNADWASCYVYSAKTDELVLACSVGKRLDKPGSMRLSANTGIESHVLSTGIAVNVAHAYSEAEFSDTQDAGQSSRTRSELVFPLMKPDGGSHTFGILQLCNKGGGTAFFDANDEIRAAECAFFIASIMAKFPSDVTNPVCFDPALVAAATTMPKDDGLLGKYALIREAPRATTMVFRTARAGHIKRAEVMRDATKLRTVPSIQEALEHVTKVNDAWRNAVLLNMELEKEIGILHDGLNVSKRENSRLQTLANELKKQLEVTEFALGQAKGRRKSLQ